MAFQNIYTKKQRENLLIISIVLLLFFILYGIRDYFSSFLGSIIVFILFLPMFRFLVEKHKWKKSITAVFIIFISFVVIVLPFLFLSVLLTDKIIYYTTHYGEILNLVAKFENFSGIRLREKETVTTIATNYKIALHW